ncbi:MAG: helix-turn-helix transcriptional regulator [Bacteroidales bacterium]
MKNNNNNEVDILLNNLRKIMNDKKLTQYNIAGYAGTSESQISRIFSKQVKLSLNQLANIASGLQMPIIDLFTYPEKYRPLSEKKRKSTKILMEIDLEDDDFLQMRLAEALKKTIEQNK